MKESTIIIFSVMALVAAGYYYFVKFNVVKQDTSASKELIIGYPNLRIALPVIVAKDKGYFKEQGLNIKLKSYQTAQPMMNAIVTGKINLGGFCALPITFGAMARSKIDLLFLGGMYEDDNHKISVILVGKDNKEIKSVKDLKGKKIGILPTRAYEAWLQGIIINTDGIDLKDVIIRQVKPSSQVAVLKTGSVDALFTNDPVATIVEAKGIGRELTKEALVPTSTGMNPFYFGSFNVRKDFADKNPDIVRRVSLALDKASKFIFENQKIAKEILATKEYFPETFRSIVNGFPNSKFKLSTEVTNKDLEKIKNFYFEKHILPVNISVDGLQYEN